MTIKRTNDEGELKHIAIGDIVYIHKNQLPITDNWLGEGDKFKHTGPYLIHATNNITCVTKVIEANGRTTGCMLSFTRFRELTKRELTTKKYLKLKNREYYTN